jgi:hypothetical protein
MKLKTGWQSLFVALSVLMCVASANAQAAPPAGGGTVQVQLWNAFVPLFAPSYTISILTPDAAITVTRIEVQLPNAPSANCKAAAVLQLNQAGVSPTSLTISSATNDSGTISVSYAASAPITMSVSTPAQCGLFQAWPALGNVTVQYSTSSGGAAKAPAGGSPAPAAPAGS